MFLLFLKSILRSFSASQIKMNVKYRMLKNNINFQICFIPIFLLRGVSPISFKTSFLDILKTFSIFYHSVSPNFLSSDSQLTPTHNVRRTMLYHWLINVHFLTKLLHNKQQRKQFYKFLKYINLFANWKIHSLFSITV